MHCVNYCNWIKIKITMVWYGVMVPSHVIDKKFKLFDLIIIKYL